MLKKLAAEFVGTFLLVFFAVGSVVFGKNQVGAVGIALTFGFVLVALVYAIGGLSGSHVNPAVTFGVFLRRGISLGAAAAYMVVQVAGAVAGAAVIKLLTSSFGHVVDESGNLGSNDWGEHINQRGDFVLEIVLTFLFVLVVLLVTAKTDTIHFAGLAIGTALTVCHLVGVPLDGTSVNPARSLGPALLNGGAPLSHVWLYIVSPLIGGLIAALVAPLLLPAPASPSGEPVARVSRGDA